MKEKEKNTKPMPQRVRVEARERDNYKCYFCGINIKDVSLANTCHHIIPRRFGGVNCKKNLITVCSKCHIKLERLNKKFEHGYKSYFRNRILNELKKNSYSKA